MKKDKNLDELFRDKLLDFEKEPPAYLLENILSGVAGARRKRKLVYWRVAGLLPHCCLHLLPVGN